MTSDEKTDRCMSGKATAVKPQADVLVVGRSCVDSMAVVDVFPREDTKAPLEFRLTEGGGQGGTASACIARLGGTAVYVGRLGKDPEGAFCLKRLKDFGVETAFVDVVSGGKTPVAYIFVTRKNGKRTIIYERNALPKLTFDDIRPALSRRPRVLLLDPETTYLARVLTPRRIGAIPMVYDCERWRQGMEAMMAAADFFIPSAAFLDSERLGFQGLSFGEKMVRLQARIKGTLIVTRGSYGAYYILGNVLYRVRAPNVPVKDTTGAGDNFHAAFALALARQWDLHAAVRFSVAVASLSCRRYGGRNGIPEEKEALKTAATLKSIRI